MATFTCTRCESFRVPDTDEGQAEMILHLIKEHKHNTLGEQIDRILHGGVDYYEEDEESKEDG